MSVLYCDYHDVLECRKWNKGWVGVEYTTSSWEVMDGKRVWPLSLTNGIISNLIPAMIWAADSRCLLVSCLLFPCLNWCCFLSAGLPLRTWVLQLSCLTWAKRDTLNKLIRPNRAAQFLSFTTWQCFMCLNILFHYITFPTLLCSKTHNMICIKGYYIEVISQVTAAPQTQDLNYKEAV